MPLALSSTRHSFLSLPSPLLSSLVHIHLAESTAVERAPLLPDGDGAPVAVETTKEFNKADHYKNVVDTAQRCAFLFLSIVIAFITTIIIHHQLFHSFSFLFTFTRNFINSSGLRMFSMTNGDSEDLR